jgi:hypothetical protein
LLKLFALNAVVSDFWNLTSLLDSYSSRNDETDFSPLNQYETHRKLGARRVSGESGGPVVGFDLFDTLELDAEWFRANHVSCLRCSRASSPASIQTAQKSDEQNMR